MADGAARYRGVVVGSSLGGVEALQLVLGALRTAIDVPIVVAHHVGPSGSVLERVLGRVSSLSVRWAVDGVPAEPGVVHLCPPRTMLRWEPDGTLTARRHEARTSLGTVDELFSSAADALGPGLLAIVLTGAGSDGTAGARAVRAAGGTVVVEDEATATASGMPRSVARAGLADLVLPLPEVPELLDRVIGRGGPLPLPEVLAVETVFAAGGATGALMAATDWSRSVLGPVERWPPVLRATLATVLGSEIAQCLLWGRELVMLYNDAFAALVGDRHPDALGRPNLTVFPELKDVAGPLLRQVWDTGRGVLQHDQPFPYLLRRGFPEEAYFTFGSGALRDGPEVVGLLSTVVETTGQVRATRRLRLLHRLAAVATDGLDGETGGATPSMSAACERAAAVLADDPRDVPFALLYLPDRAGTELHLAAATGLAPGSAAAPRHLSVADATVWPVSAVARRGESREVDDLADRFHGLACGPHPEPPTRALVLPGGRRTDGGAAAVVVLGISPRIPFDADYRSFLDLVAEQVGAALLAARRRHETRERITALAALDRDRTEFFAGVSHEFRTPLTLTLGALEELLERPAPLPDDVAEAARLAHRNALRLLKLVNTLLEFARLEQGRAAPRLEDVDLAALTVDVAGVFRSAVERAGLTLALDCPPLGRAVPVDPEMWERIVLNLLSNALKHTFTGSITVALRQRHQHVELEVTDSGIGIADDQLPHLFTRFHRVRGARARSHEGSGLGLALVQQLARLHHGTVRVRSVPGEGSRFTVWLPLAQRRSVDPAPAGVDDRPTQRTAYLEEAELWLAGAAPPDGIRDAAPPVPALPGHRPAVLLVDDNPDMRDYVRRLLAHRYAVTTAPDGRAALDALEQERFDLVLSDVMMPELDGLELLAKIRTDPRHRATPVILLTALADQDATIAALAAGAHDYVVKPFTARELLARVEAQLALARLRADPASATNAT